MIDITVIMPSLNVAPYIEECISSVENQTLKNIEILCIDAGSTDGTLKILQSHAKKDSRINIINSSVKSYGYQVNLGIRKAQGEYISIVETDDYIADNMLEVLYSYALKFSPDYVKSSNNHFKHIGNRRVFFKHQVLPENSNISFESLNNPREHAELHRYGSYIWDGIYKKKFLNDYGIALNESSGAAFQDMGVAHWVLATASKAVYINEPLYQYRNDREESSTWNRNCLRYPMQEFKRLFEQEVIPEEYFADHRTDIDINMIFEFKNEASKLMQMPGFDLESDDFIMPYEWFKLRIEKELSDGIVDYDMFDIETAAELDLLLNKPGSFADLVRARSAIEKNNRKRLFDVLNGKNLIVFGSGIRGSSFVVKLQGAKEINIDAFVDNDEAKWNTVVNGIEIISPEMALKRYSDDLYIIANKLHAGDIKSQLLRMGIAEEQIMIYEMNNLEKD